MENFLQTYKWPIIGALTGLILALLFITIGFFKTLLIVGFTVLGLFLGFYVKRTKILDQFFKNNH